MAASENRRLLDSSTDQASTTIYSSTASEARISGSDIRRSLTSNGSTAQHVANSSDATLLFFKRDYPTAPTVWESQSTSLGIDSTVRKHGTDDSKPKLTETEFFMQLLKASIGSGILASSSALSNAGLVFGLIAIVFTSLTVVHSINLLVECSHFLRDRFGLQDVYLDYGNTVEFSFVFGTRAARKYRWTSKLLNVSLGVVQFGIAVVYVLFIGETTKNMVEHYQPEFNQPLIVYMACTSTVMLPIVFIKSINFLTRVATLGNLFMVVCMALILAYCCQDIPPMENYPLITTIERIPLFFGVVVFSFESINVLLPIEAALADKRNLLGPFGLLNSTYYLVIIIYLAVAFFGYAKFGESVKGSLTYSLPFSPWYAMIVKPLYALLIALTFGLQNYVLMEITWQAFESITPSTFHKRWIDNVLRVVMYVFVFGVAVGVPYIAHVISFTGALAGSSICLLFPPLIHTILFWDHSHRFSCFKFTVAKNILVFVFGVFGAIIGSYTSILAIYNEIQKDNH